MSESLSHIDQVTSEWLTERLRHNGHLDSGAVVDVKVVPITDDVARLEVSYSESRIDLPDRFVLKLGDPGGYSCIDTEVRFHSELVSRMPASPTVPWFDALYDREIKKAHILYQDVGSTHFHREASDPAGLKEDCERLATALAQFQAFWWDHDDLGTIYPRFPKPDTIVWGAGPSSFADAVARVVDQVGDRLPAGALSIYERALTSYPFNDLYGKARLSLGNRITIINHDLKNDNVFFPKDPEIHPVYIIDWAFFTLSLGTDDLANFGLHGFCDPEVSLTRDVVRCYYDALLDNGVEDYRWEDCWHDYRISSIRNMFIPINSFKDNDYSWGNLRRSLASFEDLGCEELLD